MSRSNDPAGYPSTPGVKRPTLGKYALLAAASVLLCAGFLYVLKAGALPALPSDISVGRLGFANLLLYSLSWLFVLFLKASRWRYQLAPLDRVPLGRVLSASLLGFTATLLLPFRTGEFARPWLITRGTRVPFFAAVSTSATERIIDAAFASCILIGSLLNAKVITPLPEKIGEFAVPTRFVTVFGYGAAAVSLTAIAVAIAFYVFQERALWLIETTLGRLWKRGAAWLVKSLAEFAQGLAFLTSRSNAVRFLCISVGYWGCYWFGVWFLLHCAGFTEASWAQAGVVVGTLAFGMSLPNAPGFFGAFQIATYASLALFFSTSRIQTEGALFVFWLYVLQLGWVIALAPVALLLERRSQAALATVPAP